VTASDPDLNERLREAKRSDDVDAEVGVLLEMGEQCLRAGDLGGAFMRFRFAERVMRDRGHMARRHEALGGMAVVRRRREGPAAAVEGFADAERAAGEDRDPAGEARWALRRASALRAAGEAPAAQEAVLKASALLREESDPPGLLADLQGQLGMSCLYDAQDEDAAEDHYLSAVELARVAGDDDALSTWATNLGTAYARRRRYAAALEAFEEAIEAGRRTGSDRRVSSAAGRLADCLSRASRFAEGGDRLVKLAGELADAQERWTLLNRAHELFDRAGDAERVRDTGAKMNELAGGLPLTDEAVASVKRRARRAEERLAQTPGHGPAGGPTALDFHLVSAMSAAEKGNLAAASEACELICDLKTALVIAGGEHWKRAAGGDLLTQTGFDVRAFGDGLRMLLEGGEVATAFELLQRYKAPGFCASLLRRYARTGAPSPEADRYVAAALALQEAMEGLAGPVRPDAIAAVRALRAAGERLREAGEQLRERDPNLHARLGGVVRPDDLIDALPAHDPVAIVDFIVGRSCTCGVVIVRKGATAGLVPMLTPAFTTSDVAELLRALIESELAYGFGAAQAHALALISATLHDRFLCELAKRLTAGGAGQLIFVPDQFTRFLPLHLARVCGKELRAPVETSHAEFLCEALPIEFAPCVQAVAVGQFHRRPREITRISGFADPGGDLPAAAATLEGFGERLAEPGRYDLKVGSQATTKAVSDALQEADMLLFGTHAARLPAAPEDSHLVLADGVWALRDMIDAPDLARNPLLVLAACEIGAAEASMDDRDAYGIPGALLATGAASVVANLWPVEDVTAGYLMERFLHYLSHPGYRPAAALFRAVRDMRALGRDEALALCRHHAALVVEAGAAPRAILSAENLVEWIEDSDAEHPLAEPMLWGATVVVGSGWALPAGGAVTYDPLGAIDRTFEQVEADRLAGEGAHAEALERAARIAARSDGVARAHALTTMAYATFAAATPGGRAAARRGAGRLLARAQLVARAEEDGDLIERVAVVRRLIGADDVEAQEQ
jgi:CHAT domain-containing protein/tetratricopeptide (TPR) repeat protein